MTFAGSPDRVEARLVPEAGYELDTFEIAGFPRRPSLGLLRSLITAGRAPRACAAILKRRRPHVVLGGGGYVAGPMVYAAWRRKLPAALTEADAHLGLANRLAAPFARRVFLAYGIRGPRRLEVPRHRPAGAKCAPWRLAGGGPAPLGDLGRCARAGVLRSARRGAQSQRVRGGDVRRLGADGPARLGRAGLRGPPRARAQGRLRAPRVDERVRGRTRRSRPRDLARGWDRLGAGRGGHACDPRALSPRDGRPPDAERTPLRAWRRRRRRPGDRARARARCGRRAACRPDRGSNRCARRCCRWRGRRPQRRSRRS